MFISLHVIKNETHFIAKAYADSEEKGEWFEKLVRFVENL